MNVLAIDSVANMDKKNILNAISPREMVICLDTSNIMSKNEYGTCGLSSQQNFRTSSASALDFNPSSSGSKKR